MKAKDLLRIRALDPEFQRKQAARDAAASARSAKLREADAPIRADLAAIGIQVERVSEFFNGEDLVPEAVPILLRHLRGNYPDPIRESIARALANPLARSRWKDLLVAYRAEPADTGAKDGLAVALSVLADDAVIDEFLANISDSVHGGSRILMVHKLAKFARKSRAAADLVEKLRVDPQLKKVVEKYSPRAKRKPLRN